MAYALKFGTYSFPPTFYPAQEPSGAVVPMSKLPGGAGSRVSGRSLNGKVLQVEGGLVQNDTTPLRNQIDVMKAALQGSQSLYFEDDRYWKEAQLRDFEVRYEGTGFGRWARVALSFVTGDPYQYSTAVSTSSTSITASGQSISLTNGGNAPALPQYALTVAGSGTVNLALTLTNTTTGEVCLLNGAVTGGDVITIDALAENVLRGSSAGISLFDGVFPSLASGANALTIAYTSGSISNLTITYRARWY